jgi:hypothetical protein
VRTTYRELDQQRDGPDHPLRCSNRGLGTWIYEPEHPAQSGIGIGIGLFMSTSTDAGAIVDAWPVFIALPNAMTVYDQMRTAYAARL